MVNTATVDGSEFDPNPDNNTSTAETVIDTLADISVVKTGPATAQADTRITWDLVVGNSGPNPAENVLLADPLPLEVTNPSVTTSQGNCNPSVACSLGTIPVDGSVVITIEADIPRDAVVGDTITNTARVTTTTDEINTDNNVSTAETEILAPTPYPPDVSIFKERSNDDEVKVGDIVVFRLTATNNGEVTANNVVIKDKLSPKLRYISSSIPGGKCSEKNATVTCRRASLAGGESVTAKIKVRTIDTGKVVNTATVSASNGTVSVPSWTIKFPVGKGKANIRITKKADRRKTKGGGKVKYRIKVRDVSDRAAVDVDVCDQIPPRTTVVRSGGGRLQGGRICWEIPYFAAGATREFRVTLRVDRFYTLNSVNNRATARAGNVAGTRQASAKVGVIRINNSARGGGVTG